jgi:hypothetical protein
MRLDLLGIYILLLRADEKRLKALIAAPGATLPGLLKSDLGN